MDFCMKDETENLLKKRTRYLVVFILFIDFFSGYGQDSGHLDSIYLRVFNHSKYFLKSYSLYIDKQEFMFNNVESNKYSNYQKLPYLWTNNSTQTVIVVKRKYINTIIKKQIDHIGDKVLNEGKFTIVINSRKKNKKFRIEEILNQDNF